MASAAKCVGYEWFLLERGIKPLIWQSSLYLAESQDEARKLNALGESRGQKGVRYICDKSLLDNYGHLNAIDNLEIALEYEPLDLYLVSQILKSFTQNDAGILERRLSGAASPSLRRIGYYYETLTKNELRVNAVSQKSNVEELIDSSRYFTAAPKCGMTEQGEKWRIIDNTLGKLGVLAPVIRKNAALGSHAELVSSYSSLIDGFPAAVKDGILEGLYAADSIANFAIEEETLSREDSKFEKFVEALRDISSSLLDFSETALSGLQRICVDEADKAAYEYRNFQNAIGGRLGTPSYICPPPSEVKGMMEALRQIRENAAGLPPAAGCAAVSGSFVLIHPFADGNGRISRLLMHDSLSRAYQDTPVIPVCLGIKERRAEYIGSLAKLTSQVMKRTNYTIEDNHYKLLDVDTDIYRYPDFTEYAEFLDRALRNTLETQIPKEVEKTRVKMYLSEVFAEPELQRVAEKDRNIIIESITNNNGKLSNGFAKKLLKRGICTEEQLDSLRNALSGMKSAG